ncbi:MAG: hypothetical protein ACE5EG_05565 [Thermoanaerobaculia bacterium]
MKRLWITLLLAGALVPPLEAGIAYKARTWQEGQQANRQAEITVWARIDGDRARIEFQESGNPWMTKGSYLLTTDGGKTLYLVKPEDKSYGEFDLDQVMQLLGALSESGVIDFEIENPRLETLERGPGKSVAGIATKHARYRTTYDMQMKILGFKKRQQVETVQDVWYTTEVRDAGMGVWLRRQPPRTGTDLDRLIDLEVEKMGGGFPLETAETMTMTGRKGRQTTTITRMRVSELDRGASFAPGIYVIPSDYTPVEFVPTEATMAGGQQETPPEEEKKGGIMGRFKKLGKKNKG